MAPDRPLGEISYIHLHISVVHYQFIRVRKIIVNRIKILLIHIRPIITVDAHIPLCEIYAQV